jgi:hypothetical protein
MTFVLHTTKKQTFWPAFFMFETLDKPLLQHLLSASFITIFGLKIGSQKRRKLLISLKKIQK